MVLVVSVVDETRALAHLAPFGLALWSRPVGLGDQDSPSGTMPVGAVLFHARMNRNHRTK